MKVAGAGNLSGGSAGGEVAAALLEWEDGDRFSFEDSDRFEEDSLCSWSSEPESVCNNWRGWKKPTNTSGSYNFSNGKRSADGELNFFVLPDAKRKALCSTLGYKPSKSIHRWNAQIKFKTGFLCYNTKIFLIRIEKLIDICKKDQVLTL